MVTGAIGGPWWVLKARGIERSRIGNFEVREGILEYPEEV